MGLLDRVSGWLGGAGGGGGGGVQATVLVLGLDRAGKTALLRALRPPAPPAPPAAAPPAPATAPGPDNFTSGGVSFSAWDVSGAARHRALWERHYSRADAIIFVVDAADHLRLVVAREELELVLSHPALAAGRGGGRGGAAGGGGGGGGGRVPLLVCANKADAPHALSAPRVAAALGLPRAAGAAPWHVCSTSATAGGGAGAGAGGAGLADGIAWLARQLRDQHVHR